ncbi:hypothetical protein RFI_09329, partial [Reticulomyxa filosa]
KYWSLIHVLCSEYPNAQCLRFLLQLYPHERCHKTIYEQYSPLDLAISYENYEVIQVLLRYEALHNHDRYHHWLYADKYATHTSIMHTFMYKMRMLLTSEETEIVMNCLHRVLAALIQERHVFPLDIFNLIWTYQSHYKQDKSLLTVVESKLTNILDMTTLYQKDQDWEWFKMMFLNGRIYMYMHIYTQMNIYRTTNHTIGIKHEHHLMCHDSINGNSSVFVGNYRSVSSRKHGRNDDLMFSSNFEELEDELKSGKENDNNLSFKEKQKALDFDKYDDSFVNKWMNEGVDMEDDDDNDNLSHINPTVKLDSPVLVWLDSSSNLWGRPSSSGGDTEIGNTVLVPGRSMSSFKHAHSYSSSEEDQEMEKTDVVVTDKPVKYSLLQPSLSPKGVDAEHNEAAVSPSMAGQEKQGTPPPLPEPLVVHSQKSEEASADVNHAPSCMLHFV